MISRILVVSIIAAMAVLGRDLLLRPQSSEAVFANTVVVADSDAGSGWYTSLELDSLGNPVVSYKQDNDQDVRLLHCGNPFCTAGNTKNPVTTPFVDDGYWTSLELTSAGNPIISHYGASRLWFVSCDDPSCSSSTNYPVHPIGQNIGQYSSMELQPTDQRPLIAHYNQSAAKPQLTRCSVAASCLSSSLNDVDASSSDGSHTAMALDTSQNPVIVYSGNGTLRVHHCTTAFCGGGTTPRTAASGLSEFMSVVVDPSNNYPVVAYTDFTAGQLKIMRCNDFDCDPTVPESIEAPDVKTEGRYTSLALDSAGYPVVSYYDSSHNDLKILHCNDANCAGGGESITSPDTDGDVGQFTSLKLDAAGNPVVSYFDNTNEQLKVLHCGNAKCAGAVEFTSPAPIGPTPGTDISLALDRNGNPVVAYHDYNNGDLELLHCHSASCTGGKTFTTIDSTGDVGWNASLVLDASGNPLIAYKDNTNDALKFVHCDDPNCVAESPIELDSTGDTGNDIALARDGTKLVIAYRTLGPYPNDQLKVLSCATLDCLPMGRTLTTPYASSEFGGLSLAIDPGTSPGIPVIAFQTVPWYDGDLRLLRCGNEFCSSATVEEPDNAGGYHDMGSLALDVDGHPVIAYHSIISGFDLRVVHCNDDNCAGGNDTPRTPDTAGDVGAGASLELDSDGNPVISYYDATNGNLKILRCGNSGCTRNPPIASPDTIGDVGKYSSLKLDADDHPVIAYFDQTNGYLKVLRCGTRTCRSGNSLASIPSAPGSDVGRYTSLELDPSGNPVVSYLDMTAGEVQILKCDDPDCAAGGDSVIFSAPVATDSSISMQDTLQLDPSGYPVLAYIDPSGYKRLRVLHCNDAACSGGGDSDLPLAQGVGNASLELNESFPPEWLPVVVHQQASDWDTDLAYCTDPNCDPAIPAMDGPEHINPVVSDSSRGISLALAGSSAPRISYVSEAPSYGNLVLVKCTDFDCDAFGTIEEVGTGGYPVSADGGTNQSLALDEIGGPVIAFKKSVSPNIPLAGLAIAHCYDSGCDSLNESVVVVDSSPAVGEQPSLFVDDSGIPAVSYYDARNGDLKLVRCGNGDCSSGIVVTTVDSEGDVGRYSSLELDTLGNPVISYYESIGNPPTGGRLKIVHCDNPTCSGGKAWTRVGTEVRVDLGDGVEVTFASVKAPGTTTLLTTNSGPLPPSGYTLGNPPVHYEISTTADVNPPITVCITWTEGTFPSAMEPELHLFHYQGDGYYNIENFGYPHTDENKICGNPVGLSPFTLGTLGAGNNFVRTDLTNGGTTGQATSLALDASGLPVVAYYQSYPDYDLRVQHCNDPNCAGGDDRRVPADATGDVGFWSSVAVDASDNPVVSYRSTTDGDLRLLHCDDSTCTGTGESITAPDSGDVYFTSMVLDPIGNPVVAYYDLGQSELNVLHCDDPNCAGSESIAAPDSAGDVGLYPSVTLDGLGNPVVSYYDATNGNLKLLHCNDPFCTGGDESITSPGTTGDVGLYTSIELDSSGNPVVSYCSGVDIVHCEDLFVLHCNDADCAPGGDLIIDVDSTIAQVGEFSSLELDSAGNPVVSYYDYTNGNLKVIHCDDTHCVAGGNSIVEADTAGNVGSYSSLELDAAGMPVISYFDQTNADLKLLHCADPNCALGPNVAADMDGDGCPTSREQEPGIGSQTSGGRRDATNPWDYFNPSQDGINRTDDITRVILHYGHDDNGDPLYSTAYDRTPLTGGYQWQFGPPSGTIRTFDITAAILSYGQDCS